MGRRPTTIFVCQECGGSSPKWLGRCPDCGAWDCLVEEVQPDSVTRGDEASRMPEVLSLQAVEEEEARRTPTGTPILDRVLGGGLVTGSAVLLAGEPGIGKSTLLLQLADSLGSTAGTVLYVSAEESASQLRLRAERLGCNAAGVQLIAETALESIQQALAADRYQAILVDSVQAIRSLALSAPPGAISQVRQVANRLVEICKRCGSTLVMVGHITKDGAIAGPKSLEHLVDTVLSFEGDGAAEYRILRATKNRFGPTGEVAMFEMHDSGLLPITDPSRVLVSQRREDVCGSAVTSSLQGLRPLLVEVQALVHATSFPAPRRMAVGCDSNRLVLLVAVLERFGGLSFADRDIFVNAVGGLTLREPAADLAISAALASALLDRPLPKETVFFGEVGLLGEVRPVSRVEARLKEAANLGYCRAVMPTAERELDTNGIEIQEIDTLSKLLQGVIRRDASA
jgi:DNA repair protein RadA/Sms